METIHPATLTISDSDQEDTASGLSRLSSGATAGPNPGPFIYIPKSEGGWTCCKCNSYNSYTTRKCESCTSDHEKCNLCLNDADDNLTRGDCLEEYCKARLHVPSEGLEFPRPPDMAPNWICCFCGQINPHALCFTCAVCGHRLCSCCREY
ncbi:hypothetical protein BDV06DRAFT_196017 [Aspergillus oleicola]